MRQEVSEFNNQEKEDWLALWQKANNSTFQGLLTDTHIHKQSAMQLFANKNQNQTAMDVILDTFPGLKAAKNLMMNNH